MTLSPAVLVRVLGCKLDFAESWAPHIQAAAEAFDLLTEKRLAAFLAQTAHESARFTRLEEGLNYSAAGLLKTWPKRFTPEEAERYARHPEMIANRVYAGRMGNRDEASGDGWRHRGMGLIQLTGATTQRACLFALGLDAARPSDLTIPRWAAMSAGWFWQTRGLNVHADAGDFLTLSGIVNVGHKADAEQIHGLNDRYELWDKAKIALHDNA